MGFIATKLTTNETFYSKGANKIADLIGCNYSTITKFFSIAENKHKEKVFKGYSIQKTIDLANKNRGSSAKSSFKGFNAY